MKRRNNMRPQQWEQWLSPVYENLSTCSHYNHIFLVINVSNHPILVIMMLIVINLTLTRLERIFLTQLFLIKQTVVTNCYLKEHYLLIPIIKHLFRHLEILETVVIQLYQHHTKLFLTSGGICSNEFL